MSSATSTDLTLPVIGGKHHFLLRRLHSLTGLIFGGYLVVHLLVNATIVQGGEVYQEQVNKIHELPFLWAFEWVFIYLPIIYHSVYGAWITLTGQPNVSSYPFAKNWFYLIQRISAAIIFLFLFFHVMALKVGLFGAGLKFSDAQAMRSVATHMDQSALITWVVYPLGILASCFHLANGFWTGAITWGLTVSKGAQRRWGMVCIGIFVVTLAAGLTALTAAAAIDPAKMDQPRVDSTTMPA